MKKLIRKSLPIFSIAIALSIGKFHLQASERHPNVIVILTDDQGYGDVGFNGCKDIPTPALDSIANSGANIKAGYVTAPQCAPSRTGFISGRYQNTFGREINFALDNYGMPSSVKTIADYMKTANYTTGMVGKWHLGSMEGSRPWERGFDYFYGFLAGSSFYVPQEGKDSIEHILENQRPVKVTEYLTDVLGDKACEFVERNAERPFFLYISFNAPHTPMEATEKYLKRFRHIKDPGRRTYAAMVSAVDDATANLLSSLRKHDLEEDTIIFFLSDNGGPIPQNSSNNQPLRGVKGDTLEGGIRVPFAVQWKGKIPAGQTIDTPIISLDILPTALASAGQAIPENLDGQNLLPLLVENNQLEPRTLFWRFPHPSTQTDPNRQGWAILEADNWKVANDWRSRRGPDGKNEQQALGLYNLNQDIDESKDLKDKYRKKYESLKAAYDAWADTLPPLLIGNRESIAEEAKKIEDHDQIAPWANK